MMSLKGFLIEWKLKNTHDRAYMVIGAVFLLLALIGVMIPIVPQVPFAIISAYFFSKGSYKIHMWMRHNKYFGTPVREWEDFRVIRPKMKAISSVSLAVSMVLGHLKFEELWMAYSWDAISLACIIFILTRRSRILFG